MYHILIVEDDPKMVATLERGLKQNEYKTTVISNGLIARGTDVSGFDVIILDWMLPNFTGVDLIKFWRSKDYNVPILMFTARSEIDDKVAAFDYGADDYLTKFFEWDELLARLKALIRRSQPKQLTNLGTITFDPEIKEFRETGEVKNLTKTEYNILSYFFRYPHKIISRTDLIRAVYDFADNPYSNVIDRHINSIRHKFNYDPIETVHGFGYRLRFDA